MDKLKELNRNINKLYRQLGKEVYQSGKESPNGSSSKLIKKIDKAIERLGELKGKNSKVEIIEENKVILPPEKDESGISFYLFCKNCRVGNNPNSSHCIKCGEKLA